MGQRTSLFSRFIKNESGAFAAMFALMAVVLIALTGAVVDYTSMEEKRNRAQIALDAAALALQPRIHTDDPEAILVAAAALVRERLGTEGVDSWVTGINIDLVEGVLELRGGLRVPMHFARLVGVEYLEASISSEVQRKKLELEVVMVLDNSGSMLQENRMTYLKQAAACATRTLFYEEVDANCNRVSGSPLVENVRIGVVPFTMYVNVGAHLADSYWLDWAGDAPISSDNFNTSFRANGPGYNGGPVDRTALFANLRTTQNRSNTWTGCVVARQHPLDINDTPPSLGTPPADPETLFTPLFSPDARDGVTSTYISDVPTNACPPMRMEVRRIQNCNSSGNNCNAGTYSCRTQETGNWSNWTTSSAYNCAIPGGIQLGNPVITRGSTTTTVTTYSLLSAIELQERVCKYNVRDFNGTTTNGPNAYCPTIAIQPLSDNPTTVNNHIQSMVADGGTNIHEGTAWGMRVLSPGEPFTEGGPYSDSVSKVLIVMTDGENTAYPANNMNWSSYYSAYGFPTNNRMGAYGWSQDALDGEMDRRTLATCTTAKQLGMTIYTIGLTVTQPETVAMLRSCASSADQAYFPAHPRELNGVFMSIAQQLAALRISR